MIREKAHAAMVSLAAVAGFRSISHGSRRIASRCSSP
jgi:hypothetical protein